MKEEFFKYAGFLFAIAAVALSVVFGVRAGLISNDVWQGVKTGGACLFGAALFVLGVVKFHNCHFDSPIAKVLWAISLIGVAVYGVALIASVVVSPDLSVVSYGLIAGGSMFTGPVLLAAAYFCVKSLIVFIDEHRMFSAVTAGLSIAIGVAMYFVAGTLNDAFASAFGFLFFWAGISVFVYAWKSVENEETARYWHIGFAMVIAFFASGLSFVLSEVLVNVVWLHKALFWISQNVGLPVACCLVGYVILLSVVAGMRAGWPKLVGWAK